MFDIRLRFEPPLSEIANKFRNIDIEGFLSRKIRELAFLVERESKIVSPVKTGRMRASIRVMGSGQKFRQIIQPNVDYAIFVHEGTRYMKGRPFMFWGATTAVADFNQTFAKDLDAEIKKNFS
jgi:HK97 gp10 family phage protein